VRLFFFLAFLAEKVWFFIGFHTTTQQHTQHNTQLLMSLFGETETLKY